MCAQRAKNAATAKEAPCLHPRTICRAPHAPVLSAPLLARIYELNLDYIDLLIAEHAATDADRQLHHLPEKLSGAVGRAAANRARPVGALAIHAVLTRIRRRVVLGICVRGHDDTHRAALRAARAGPGTELVSRARASQRVACRDVEPVGGSRAPRNVRRNRTKAVEHSALADQAHRRRAAGAAHAALADKPLLLAGPAEIRSGRRHAKIGDGAAARQPADQCRARMCIGRPKRQRRRANGQITAPARTQTAVRDAWPVGSQRFRGRSELARDTARLPNLARMSSIAASRC